MVTANVGNIFSPPALREVMRGNFAGRATLALRRLQDSDELPLGADATVADGLDALHHWLERHYRNEYFYKNLVANKILIGRHSVRTATMLSEFAVGNSVADCVVVNGVATAYEIKTELDTPVRLRKQLDDYRRAFSRVAVVTHYSLAGPYLKMLENEPVGLLVLTPRGTLAEAKPLVDDATRLSIDVMFRALRKPEYTAATGNLTGYVPDVPNTQHFRACASRVKGVDPEAFHSEFRAQLRRRTLTTGVDHPALGVIRQLCFKLAPDSVAMQNLFSWLDLRIGGCTTPICEVSNTNSLP